MNLSKYQCLNCQQSQWQTYSTFWKCEYCGRTYTCVNGIPKLYFESTLAEKDRQLRDRFYDGLLGTYYQYVMPFLSLPVRPAIAYWKGWTTYAFIVFALLTAVGYLVNVFFFAARSIFRQQMS
jgi:hypothetical protein